MNIDAHQHFWKYNPREYAWIDDSMTSLRRDFLPEQLQAEMTESGFQGSIAVQVRQSLEETRRLLNLAEHHAFILGVVGWVDLRSPEVSHQLASFAGHPKLVGIRHIVESEPDDGFLLRPDFLRGISALDGFELAYDILIYPKHLPAAVDFVRRFERQRFVLDHLAKPDIKAGTGPSFTSWARDLQELAVFPNVFCKLSGLVTETGWRNWNPEDFRPYLDAALDCFGPERLMIGSDWPVCTLAASYSQVMSMVQDYLGKYSPAVRDAVLGGNAKRFWKLP